MKDAPLVSLKDNPIEVLIRPVVLKFIAAESARHEDGRETGGILIGVDDGKFAEIRCAGGPGPKAIRRPHFLSRDSAFAQQLVDEEWLREGSNWIGEWHTHNFGRPLPSSLDCSTYQTLIAEPDLGFNRFFSLIVRGNSNLQNSFNIALWVVDQECIRPCHLVFD